MFGQKWAGVLSEVGVTDFKANGRSTRTEIKNPDTFPGTGREPIFLNRERVGTGNIKFENHRERRERVGTRHWFPSISDGRCSLKMKWFVEIIGCISATSASFKLRSFLSLDIGYFRFLPLKPAYFR